MLRFAAIVVWLLLSLPAQAQMLLLGAGPGSAGGACVGAACTSFSVSGPSSGTVGVASTAFTVTLSTGSFSGAQTITIADGAQGGTITPSVGSSGVSSVVVTPTAAATSFTFTYNPASTGAKTLTFTNAQGWTNAGPASYTATARTFTATGPSTGTAGSASTNFTVTIGNGTFNGTDTITIADGSQGGTITPSVGSPGTSSVTVTPTNGATSFTFTYNAAVGAAVTLTFTNAQSWTNPATLPYTGAVTYTASGPSTGTTGSPSTNFTVSMPAGVQFNGSQTITIADASAGGTFTPSVGSPGTSTVTVTPAAAATSFTFTYNAATDGAKTLTFTNAQSWTNPSPLTYTSSTVVAYTGPGDVVSGATAFWTCGRAYTAAYATANGKLCNLRNTSTNETCDVLAATSGNMGNTASCSGSSNGLSVATFCALSGGSCAITKFYDQTTNTYNTSQATAGSQPPLTLNCLNTTLPCVRNTSGNMTTAAVTSIAQPLTISTVYNRTANFTTNQDIFTGINTPLSAGTMTTANNAILYAGGVATAAATDSTLHAIQFIAAGGVSVINVDNTQNAVNPSTGATGTSIGVPSSAHVITGTTVGEVGLWPFAFTTLQQTNMCHNQRLYWGSTGSC